MDEDGSNGMNSYKVPSIAVIKAGRKKLPGAALFLFLLFFSGILQAEILKEGDTVAICGDSITEQRLYSVYLETYFLACQPVQDLQAHQFGWSGESAGGLAARVRNNVLPFRPDVVTTLYGMNDGGYVATDVERVKKFREGTEQVIARLKEGGVRRILIASPGVVDSEMFKTWRLAKVPPDVYNQTLINLGAEAREVAKAQGVDFVDVNGVMMTAMHKAKEKYGSAFPLAKDGVHPEALGHMVMAYAFLKGLGCKGEIGTITVDLASAKSTASEGHKVLSFANGLVELESTRYPFCFPGKTDDPNSTLGVMDLTPFSEELNRLQLVIVNGRAAHYKITWGRESKAFSSAQLARGINLAAEFLDNPFLEPFRAVESAVRKQQEFETPAVKGILQTLPGWKNHLPENQVLLDQVKEAVVRKAAILSQSARAALVPVKHQIKIEATP